MALDIKLSSAESKRPGFIDLPGEIQKEIVSHVGYNLLLCACHGRRLSNHTIYAFSTDSQLSYMQCSQSDWICLSLVSSHFRELAAAHLYRNFHIVFPDDDDKSFDSPIDGLAGGLDTFVTSDYNYAKHLRDISLDTLSTGSKAELAYKSYLFSVSCGKFMNTLLLLTLRKAKSLDTFRWNIRVELSRPVYKALHNIKSLRHLHLRLQAGPSLYEPPPPLSDMVADPSMPTPGQDIVQFGDQTFNLPPLNIAPLAEMPSSFGIPSDPSLHTPHPPAAPLLKSSLPRNNKRSASAREPPTLGGFKGLETLALLDIDNLDVITEIKSCVRNSSSTLRKLKLSFSDALALQARRPSLEAEPEDSDQEDDFQVVAVPSTAQYNDGNGPAKIFRAQEERKAQEAVLGRIFEVAPFLVKEHRPIPEETGKRDKGQTAKAAGQAFIDAVEKASRRMWANLEGTSEFDIMSQQQMMDQIATAARLYVESKEAQNQENTATEATATAPVATDLAVPGDQNESSGTPGKSSTSGNTLFGANSSAEDTETKPEDIDVAAPEEQLGIDEQDESITEPQSGDPVPAKSPAGPHRVSPLFGSGAINKDVQLRNLLHQLDTTLRQLEKDADEVTEVFRHSNSTDDTSEVRIDEARGRLSSIHHDMANVQHEINVVEAEIYDAEAQARTTSDDKEELRRRVTEYARGTRGIGLESLAIYLIPTKASVLGKAVDLRTLKKITLLNVGPQARIWALMINENMLQPLPLQRIFTDNVCPYLLQLISQLHRVDEILLLERTSRSKPESFAQKTRVNIDQIRKMVLRKHMETLKILMIKNEAESTWDVDEKTMQLICRRGRSLEELAIAMGIRTMVSTPVVYI